MPRFLLPFISLLVFIVLPVSTLAAQGIENPTPTQKDLLEQGFAVAREPFPAPDFTLKQLDGRGVSLSSLQDKVIFLNFWATWCGYCKVEMPVMQEIHEEMGDDDFVILAVNVRETDTQAKEFMKEGGYTFPVLMDYDGAITSSYGVTGFPTTYIIDPEGNLIARKVGPIPEDSAELIRLFRQISGK